MDVFRPLRAALLVYEIIRLFFLTALAVFLAPPLSFPWPLYAVSNALFPLIALFLLAWLQAYRAYLPLYISGKAIALAASAGWCLFAGDDVAALAAVNPRSVLVTLGTLAFFFFGDAFSIAGAYHLHSRTEKPAETGASAGNEGGL